MCCSYPCAVCRPPKRESSVPEPGDRAGVVLCVIGAHQPQLQVQLLDAVGLGTRGERDLEEHALLAAGLLAIHRESMSCQPGPGSGVVDGGRGGEPLYITAVDDEGRIKDELEGGATDDRLVAVVAGNNTDPVAILP